MTTLAWDGRYLAGDRQATYGTTPVPVTKVFRVGDIVVGYAGTASSIICHLEWMQAGCPNPPPDFADDFGCLLVERGKLYRVGHTLARERIDMPHWAIGSGADYALGAMAMGADARTAVEVASRYDIGTGLGVDVLDTCVESCG